MQADAAKAVHGKCNSDPVMAQPMAKSTHAIVICEDIANESVIMPRRNGDHTRLQENTAKQNSTHILSFCRMELNTNAKFRRTKATTDQ